VESASERKRKAESRETTRSSLTGAWRSASGARGITGIGGGGGSAYSEQSSTPPGQTRKQSSGLSVQLAVTVVAACGRNGAMATSDRTAAGAARRARRRASGRWPRARGGGGGGGGDVEWIGRCWVWYKVWQTQRQQFGVELERMACRRRRRRRVRVPAPNIYDFASISPTRWAQEALLRNWGHQSVSKPCFDSSCSEQQPVWDYGKSNNSWTKISLHCPVHCRP
jgi:hypothetical protein